MNASTQRIRTCARCGRRFITSAREYVCVECKTRISPLEEVRGGLSFRETQIVDLVREAKANKQIAFELGLTEGTVKEYLYHIFRKVGVTNRTELALWTRPRLRESSPERVA